MHDQTARQDLPIDINVVRALDADPYAQMCLTAFYAIDMFKELGWTTEQRFLHIRRAQAMIAAGHSRMYTAAVEPGRPIAMLVTTKADTRAIRRLDAVWTANTYRRQGIARRLFQEARRGGADFHSFSSPAAVDWHLANGFRSLGATDEGTVEMFTGAYPPKYSFDHVMPLATEQDVQAMQQLRAREQERDKP